MKGSETLGYYATAYKWLDGFLIIPSTFTFAVFPALSRFAEQTGEGLRAAYDISLRVLVCLAIPIAASVAYLSGDLILALGGRAYYPESANALAILIWFLPFSYVNGLTQFALVAVKRQRFITIAFFVAATFNLVANLLFIPRFGLYATSVVTVLSEVVLMIPFLIAVRGSIGSPDWLAVVGKPVLAGAFMLLAVMAGNLVERHLALLVGLAVYVAVIWRLDVFSADEIGVLRRLVRRPKMVTATA
jgi:O-antigen/teichoic acid export membrane protein